MTLKEYRDKRLLDAPFRHEYENITADLRKDMKINETKKDSRVDEDFEKISKKGLTNDIYCDKISTTKQGNT